MGENYGSATSGCRAIHHMRAPVRIDGDLAIVPPVLRTNIKSRNAAESYFRNGVLVALQQWCRLAIPSASANARTFCQPTKSSDSGNPGMSAGFFSVRRKSCAS